MPLCFYVFFSSFLARGGVGVLIVAQGAGVNNHTRSNNNGNIVTLTVTLEMCASLPHGYF